VYQDYWNTKWGLASEASHDSPFGDDQLIRERLLSLLYLQRRLRLGYAYLLEAPQKAGEGKRGEGGVSEWSGGVTLLAQVTRGAMPPE
jgi:hypothetical protein